MHLVVRASQRVWIHNFATNSPSTSPNTDSIHLSSIVDAVVENCTLHGGESEGRGCNNSQQLQLPGRQQANSQPDQQAGRQESVSTARTMLVCKTNAAMLTVVFHAFLFVRGRRCLHRCWIEEYCRPQCAGDSWARHEVRSSAQPTSRAARHKWSGAVARCQILTFTSASPSGKHIQQESFLWG